MLEQAIADAAALREQAIKNAEQSVLDRYSKQVKEAVDRMLEGETYHDKANKIIEEAEEEMNDASNEDNKPEEPIEEASSTISAPPAWHPQVQAGMAEGAKAVMSKLTQFVESLEEDDDGFVKFDHVKVNDEQLYGGGSKEDSSEASTLDMPEAPASEGTEKGGGDDAELADIFSLQEGMELEKDDIDQKLEEVISFLTEELGEESEDEESEDEESEDEINEEVHYDFRDAKGATHVASGHPGGGGPTKRREMSDKLQAYDALQEEDSVSYEEEEYMMPEENSMEEESSSDEEQPGRLNDMHETITNLSQQNLQMEKVLRKLESHLDETLLSNAKLLYQNRTLSDASLNERQKAKIVEAIANAESPKEAKKLYETLRTTVGSTSDKKQPKSLSESVNRKGNLSNMLNSRQNINESKNVDNPLKDMMQRLAGIK
jgi:hypothetical protein